MLTGDELRYRHLANKHGIKEARLKCLELARLYRKIVLKREPYAKAFRRKLIQSYLFNKSKYYEGIILRC